MPKLILQLISIYLTYYFYLYSPRNMIAQANKTAKSKNTTNEKEKKHNDSSTLHTETM